MKTHLKHSPGSSLSADRRKRCAVAAVVPVILTLIISGVSHPLFADVLDSSLKLRFNFDAAPTNNVIVDSSPSGTHPGTNFFATWTASENGRSVVMDFKAPVPDRIVVPAIPALNSSTGTISFWIKTPGNLLRGDFAAMLVDRRTDTGDVITLTDTGVIFVQAKG